MAKPVVDGLEKKMGARLKVARVDIGTDDGEAIASKYRVDAVPAYVLLDPQGRVLWKKIGGKPDEAAIDRALVTIGR